MNDLLRVSDVVRLAREAEKQIRECIASELKDLTDTGIVIDRVSVSMVDITRVGCDPEYLLSEVDLNVRWK